MPCSIRHSTRLKLCAARYGFRHSAGTGKARCRRLLSAAETRRHDWQCRPRAWCIGARCLAWLPPGRGRGFAPGKRGRPIVRVRRRGRFAVAAGTTRPTHHGSYEAEPGCPRRHPKLFAMRSPRCANLSGRSQERARPRQRLSPPDRATRQSPGSQCAAWLVHARSRYDACCSG